jgi:hypothetical protein
VSRVISEQVLWQPYEVGATDTHGNPVGSWRDPEIVGIYAFDPGSSSEPREPGGDRVVVEPTLYMPADVVLGARDRVTARGDVYEVDGETRKWLHPDGSQRGNVVTLRRVEG